MKAVWGRWIFFRFQYRVSDEEFREPDKAERVDGYGFALNFRWFRVQEETKFWRMIISSEDLNYFGEGIDVKPDGWEEWLPACLAEMEESLHLIYNQIFNDLQFKTSLERNLMSVPENKRPARLMEYYNMGGLGVFEKLVYKLNMQNSKTLPLATQEFMKYVFWVIIVVWTGFCMFFLLSFAVKHGDEVRSLCFMEWSTCELR